MRLLFWAPLFRPYIGGIEVMLAQLIPDLKRRGYELCVISSHDFLDLPDEDEFEGVPVHRLQFQSAVENANLKAFAGILSRVAAIERDFKPDLVHFLMIHPSIFFHLRSRASHKAPLIVSFRGAFEPTVDVSKESLAVRSVKEADWVTAVSDAVLNDVRSFWPEVTDRSSRIYDTLLAPKLEPAPLPFDEARIMFVGRLVDDKAPDVAVAAFAKITDRFPKARLIIGGDGPVVPALRQQAAELGLAERVEFPGWIRPEEVWQFINRGTMVVVPSRWREALGLVAVQASQMARPVIVTRRGGLPEIVAHGETGFIIENEDVDGLAEAMTYLLEHPKEAEAMGKAGRQRMEDVFGWTKYVDSCDTLYRQIASGAHKDAHPG